MAKTIENILKKNGLALAVALTIYPLWVACDFVSTNGISVSEVERRENIKDYQESGSFYKALRIGHYLAMH